MVKKISAFFVFLLSAIISPSQEQPSVSLLIRDSVKTFNIEGNNDRKIYFLHGKIFNRKIDVNVEISNNSGIDTIILYSLFSDPREAIGLFNCIDTQNIFGNNNNQIICSAGWGENSFAPPGKGFKNITSLIDSNLLQQLLYPKECTRDNISNWTRELSTNFGFTYIIEDENGKIVSANIERFNYVRIEKYSKKMFATGRWNSDKLIKTGIAQQKKWDERLTNNLNALEISNKRTINIKIYYRNYKKDRIGKRIARDCIYYNFEPGKTYYITFYYMFYLSKGYFTLYPLTLFSETIHRVSETDTRQIFEGQITSNRVKLIVK